MRYIKICALLLSAIVVLTMCSRSHPLTGQWHRAVSDDDIEATGVESLKLNDDSTFDLSCVMSINEELDNLTCRLKYKVAIHGSWQQEYKTLTLRPDLSTYIYEADSTAFVAHFVNKSECDSLAVVKSGLYRDLCTYLSDYYKSIYSNLAESGLNISDIYLKSDTLYCNCNNSQIVWTR